MMKLESIRMRVLLLAGATAVAGCVSGSTTEVASGPFYSIVASTPDSTAYAAGSTISVRATVTHEAAGVLAAPVSWTVTAGGGVVSAATSSTDSSGNATVAWKLSDTVGTNTLVIGTVDRADTLTVFSVPGSPAYLLAPGADSVMVAAGTPATLEARVTDRVGNSLTGTTVNWSATGGVLSAGSAPTDATGISRVTFTAAAPGSYFVTAVLPGQATHIYQVVVH